MMDLRYHLASLMSVFLALAVGIVVGVSLGSSERQAATIQVLQRDVAAIRAEDSRLKELSAELRRLLATREEAQAELLPLAIRGRLAGNRVALLLTGDAAVLTTPITLALRLAGAEVPLTVRLPRGSRQGVGSRVSGVGSEPSDTRHPTPDTLSTGVAAAVRAVLQGRSDLLEGIQARVPEVEVTGELRAPIRRFLLICPNDEPEYARRVATGEGVESTVARTAREADALLVAVEPEAGRLAPDAEAIGQDSTSLLPALTALGANSVDNVDTAMGQIAMVFVLAGARGNFGTGPHANRPMPPLGGP